MSDSRTRSLLQGRECKRMYNRFQRQTEACSIRSGKRNGESYPTLVIRHAGQLE